MITEDVARQPSDLNFLSGGGEMGERIRAFDWAQHPLGPPAQWPQNLKMAVSICISSRYPIVIWWGKEQLTQFYNDGYISFLGPAKHPAFLARSGRECWSEIWQIVGSMLDTVFTTGEATWSEDFLYVIDRKLPREEGYFTFSYSPIWEADKVNGIFCACYETTGKVVGARRLETLRKLGEQSLEAHSVADALAKASAVLAENPHDIPFARIYLADAQVPEELATVLQTRQPLELTGLDIPGRAWPEPTTQAVALPLLSSTLEAVAAVMVLGVSPRRPFDPEYRAFFDLVAGHVATAIANARAHEAEKKRAEALAEVDRVKTAFFSNVSHEFRTPLTLILGTIEELIGRARHVAHAPAISGDSEPLNAALPELQLIERNSLRLLKMVNTLLEFSRIEAGRIEACYEPTDLAAYTVDLASVFRTAIEKAGLTFTVDCPPLAEPVFVDREMWEKIVLNLLSNALKFTARGEIKVCLRWRGERVELTVSDTGVGIPESELPKVFQRFHRVRGATARSHEGTGIGLALVQELAHLHGGEVRAQSAEGRGSSFIVSIQTGKFHLQPERIRSPGASSCGLGAVAFVEEALRWLPEAGQLPESGLPRVCETASPAPDQTGLKTRAARRPHILLADDNSDMRAYVSRLLASHFNVETVADGQAALERVEACRPDLVLTDVMMPRLDGFGLLQRLRADPRTRTLPVILLSARAGEESRVEGLDAGADDYLIKPFSARELLARVESHLRLARCRCEAEERVRQANVDLEAKVEERTAKLRETIHELESFSYSITHDLRAPLRAMQGFAGILEEDYAATLDDEARDHLRRITLSANRMDRLIADLLVYSRVMRMDLELAPVNVNKLLRGILETYLNLRKPAAQISIQRNLPAVLGNEAALTQCFGNLLGNAVKFVKTGVTPRVRVTAELNGGKARFWICDNGIGIEPRFLAKIFEVFQRLSTHYEGTGIGLSIVRKAAERMGGAVGAESEPGRGSRFWLELPLASIQRKSK